MEKGTNWKGYAKRKRLFQLEMVLVGTGYCHIRIIHTPSTVKKSGGQGVYYESTYDAKKRTTRSGFRPR